MRVSRISVMVHPHFHPFDHHIGEREGHVANLGFKLRPEEVPGRMRKTASRHETGLKQAVLLESLHSFYKSQIDGVAADPRAMLVLVRHKHGWFHNENTRFELVHSGVPFRIANAMAQKSAHYQRKLQAYAKRKLGDRLIVTYRPPEEVGRAVKFHLVNKGVRNCSMPIEVFGEYANLCVQETKRSFDDAGYKKAVRNPGKSLY